MGITMAEANSRLASITTADELRDLIRQLDTTGTATLAVSYSGGQMRVSAHATMCFRPKPHYHEPGWKKPEPMANTKKRWQVLSSC